MTDTIETHTVLTARHQLREVADAYDALAEIALNGGDPNALRDTHRATGKDDLDPEHTGLDGRPLGPIVGRTAKTATPANLTAIAARQEIDHWAAWMARTVIDHRDTEGQPWTPPSTDSAAILRDVADNHLGVFLGNDPIMSADFLESCLAQVKHARLTVTGLGGRWMRLHVNCAESVTDQDGTRVLCAGEYRMWMRADQKYLDDLVCDDDETHRLTPAQWFAALRRKPADPDAAARLARTLRLAAGE